MTTLRSPNPIDIMTGKKAGLEYVDIFGRNDDVDVGETPSCLWNGGANGATARYTGFDATAAETLNINSTESGDTSLGVHIFGQDINNNPIDEIVTLNAVDATTPVTTVNSYYRCSYAYVTSPVTAVNAGDIEAFQSTSGLKMFDMPAGRNNTHIAVYTVPNGKKAYIQEVAFNLVRSSNTDADCDVFIRKPSQPFRSRLPIVISEGGGPFVINGDTPLIQNLDGQKFLPAGTDIEMVVTSVSQNNCTITGFMRILLEDV